MMRAEKQISDQKFYKQNAYNIYCIVGYKDEIHHSNIKTGKTILDRRLPQ